MVSTCPLISKSSSPFNNPLVIVPKAPITIGMIYTFMFHSFFTSLARSKYLAFFSLSQFYSVVSRDSKDHNFASSLFFFFFFFIIIRSGLLAEIRWSVCISMSHRSLWASFSRTDVGLCIYNLFLCSNLNSMYISQWITLPTQSCLVWYSFCANLSHSLIMWFIVSSLSQHNLHHFWIIISNCVSKLLKLQTEFGKRKGMK